MEAQKIGEGILAGRRVDFAAAAVVGKRIRILRAPLREARLVERRGMIAGCRRASRNVLLTAPAARSSEVDRRGRG